MATVLIDQRAKYVRYAKSMTVHIEMRSDISGRIHPPYLEMDYDTASLGNVSHTSSSVGCNFHLL